MFDLGQDKIKSIDMFQAHWALKLNLSISSGYCYLLLDF